MSLTDDTIIDGMLICSGCDAITPFGEAYILRTVKADVRYRHLSGSFCSDCAGKHNRGEVLPKSSFPRTAAFSIDGRTWTLCDLRGVTP